MDINYCQICCEKLTLKQLGEFIKSCEVDQINWFSINDAMLNLREGSIGKQLFETSMSRFEDLL